MPSRYMQLPYRRGVGIVLINRNGHVWVGQQSPECAMVDAAGHWQMPQGGIEPDQPAREAALSALEKTAGVRSVQVLAEAPGWFAYELPASLIGIALNGQFCGRKQKWLAMRFLGDDTEINIEPRDGQRRMFARWRWVPASQVPLIGASLNRELYEDVIANFAPFLPVSVVPAPVGPEKPASLHRQLMLPWFVTF